jgi:hypothetical protein
MLALFAHGVPSVFSTLLYGGTLHFQLGQNSRISASVETAADLQALGGSCACDQTDDCLVVSQRFATPVGGDEGEQPVLHLVPLAGSVIRDALK